MKKHLLTYLLVASASLSASTLLAQQPPQSLLVTGNLNINADGTTYTGAYDGADTNPAGNVTLRGDVVFTGTNPWILHTPNTTGATTLYLAPGSNPINWGAATEFSANGDVRFKNNITIPGLVTMAQKASIGDVRCTTQGQCTGMLGINTLTLAVGGKIGARGGIHVVDYGGTWPDYVFAPTYELPALREVERSSR